jgi:hypothetical protein
VLPPGFFAQTITINGFRASFFGRGRSRIVKTIVAGTLLVQAFFQRGYMHSAGIGVTLKRR